MTGLGAVTMSSDECRPNVIENVGNGLADAIEQILDSPLLGHPTSLEVVMGLFAGMGCWNYSEFVSGLRSEIGRELTDEEMARIFNVVRQKHDQALQVYCDKLNAMFVDLKVIRDELNPGAGKNDPVVPKPASDIAPSMN